MQFDDGESDEQVVLVSQSGTLNSIKVRDIPIQSRYASFKNRAKVFDLVARGHLLERKCLPIIRRQWIMEHQVNLELSLFSVPAESDVTTVHLNSDFDKILPAYGCDFHMDDGSLSSHLDSRNSPPLFKNTLNKKNNHFVNHAPSSSIMTMPASSVSCLSGITEVQGPGFRVLQILSYCWAWRLIHQSEEFVVVNKHLLHDLTGMGLWTPTLKNQMIYEDGSVQKFFEIPEDLKAIYKNRTVWEIKQKDIGRYGCRSWFLHRPESKS